MDLKLSFSFLITRNKELLFITKKQRRGEPFCEMKNFLKMHSAEKTQSRILFGKLIFSESHSVQKPKGNLLGLKTLPRIQIYQSNQSGDPFRIFR